MFYHCWTIISVNWCILLLLVKSGSHLLHFLGGSIPVLGCGTFEVGLQSTYPAGLVAQWLFYMFTNYFTFLSLLLCQWILLNLPHRYFCNDVEYVHCQTILSSSLPHGEGKSCTCSILYVCVSVGRCCWVWEALYKMFTLVFPRWGKHPKIAYVDE